MQPVEKNNKKTAPIPPLWLHEYRYMSSLLKNTASIFKDRRTKTFNMLTAYLVIFYISFISEMIHQHE